MTCSWKLGELELSNDHRTGFFVTDASFPDPGSISSLSTFRGQSAIVTDIKVDPIKVQLSGFVVGRENKEALAAYGVNNYNWIADTDKHYLTELGLRRWKILSCSMSLKPNTNFPLSAQVYNFTIIIIINSLSCQGITPRTANGTANSSPTLIEDLENDGSKEAEFDSITIGGIYDSGANLTKPVLYGLDVGATLEVADVLLDGAAMEFLPNWQAHHMASDDFTDSNRWGRNKASSSKVTFSVGHLAFANNAAFKMYYSLKHALRNDPTLNLVLDSVVGTPKLNVSIDDKNYYEIATLTNDNNKYTLDKLYGASNFYWEIICGAGDSLVLRYMSLESWHSYSGQDRLYISPGATDESLRLTFDSGKASFALTWNDNYNA